MTVFAVAVGAFMVSKDRGWLSPIGIESESDDSQVVKAIERTEEVSLVRLSIEGISTRNDSRRVFGKVIPGTGQQVLLQYKFKAKLGIDGAQVQIAKTPSGDYRISVPEFSFIGYDQPTFKVVVDDGGALSFVTPDIDQTDLVNEVLDDDAQGQYLTENADILRDQTRVFYDSLIASIDPDVETRYEFATDPR